MSLMDFNRDLRVLWDCKVKKYKDHNKRYETSVEIAVRCYEKSPMNIKKLIVIIYGKLNKCKNNYIKFILHRELRTSTIIGFVTYIYCLIY